MDVSAKRVRVVVTQRHGYRHKRGRKDEKERDTLVRAVGKIIRLCPK